MPRVRCRGGIAGVASLLGACAAPVRSAPARVAPEPHVAALAIDSTRAAPERLPARVTLARAIDSLATAPEFRNAHWGILVVDAARGDTLYSRNAGKLFMPASNMKIVTASVALALLGPDYRYRTVVATRGPVCRGTLRGDLIVSGRGDPSFSDAMRGDAMLPMRELADSLAARGITRVAGRIVAGDDVFPGPQLGYGWSWDDLGETYSAGVTPLYFNEGFASIIVQGGKRAGSRVRATLEPASGYPALQMKARTGVPADSTSDVTPTAALDTVSRAIRLSGWIAPERTDTLQVVYPDQQAAFLAALATAIRERSAHLGAADRARRLPCTPRAPRGAIDTLVVYQSPPLRDVLHALLKPSQNQIAELLLHTIGLERTGVGSADSGIAVVRRQLRTWGVADDAIVMHDGSGLSRYDYVTPEALVNVLDAIRKDSAFAAFYDGLPVAGVDGTLDNRMKGTPAQGNVHAKTGFVANARSLSGYATTADGRLLIFSLLCNNWTTPVRQVNRVQDTIAERLASLILGGSD